MPTRISEPDASFERLERAEHENIRLRQELAAAHKRNHELMSQVRENLQLASSLIATTAIRWGSDTAREFGREVRLRLDALGCVSSCVDSDGTDERIEFSACLRRLCRHVEVTYRGRRGIGMRLETRAMRLSNRASRALALLATELMVNAFEHAFVDRPFGTIDVGLAPLDEQRCRFWVADNGVGLPASLRSDWPEGVERLGRFSGLKLARGLADQLGGALALQPGSGAQFDLIFPGRA